MVKSLIAVLVIILYLVTTSSPGVMQYDNRDWGGVERAIGANGRLLPGGVFMVELPRNDLNVTAGGVRLKPAFAMDSWVAFKNTGNGSMMMGDLVLTDDELGIVQKAVHRNGIEISALHSTLIGETPKLHELHIGGMGDPVKMAETIHEALSLITKPNNVYRYEPIEPLNAGISYSLLDTAMGYNGSEYDGIYQYSIARAEPIAMQGMVIPPTMDVASQVKFQPTGSGNALVTGDLILAGDEVNPVITALNDYGIEVVALHNHMLNETPRMFFLHVWANGNALDIAQGLHAALEKTNSTRSGGLIPVTD